MMLNMLTLRVNMVRVHFIMRVDIEGAFNNIRKKAIAYTQELTDSFIFDYQHKHMRRLSTIVARGTSLSVGKS